MADVVRVVRRGKGGKGWVTEGAPGADWWVERDRIIERERKWEI